MVKKLLFIIFIFASLTYSQKQSIYFDNFESIVFEATNGLKTLCFSLNRENRLTKIVIIKHDTDKYLFTTINMNGMSEPLIISESSLRSTMLALIKSYVDYHKVKISDIKKIVDNIY